MPAGRGIRGDARLVIHRNIVLRLLGLGALGEVALDPSAVGADLRERVKCRGAEVKFGGIHVKVQRRAVLGRLVDASLRQTIGCEVCLAAELLPSCLSANRLVNYPEKGVRDLGVSSPLDRYCA